MASGHSVTDVDGRLTAKVSFAYTATLSISFLSRLLRNAQCQNYFCYFPLCEKCPKCSLTRGQWPYISALTRPKYATLITLVSMCILPPMARRPPNDLGGHIWLQNSTQWPRLSMFPCLFDFQRPPWDKWNIGGLPPIDERSAMALARKNVLSNHSSLPHWFL